MGTLLEIDWKSIFEPSLNIGEIVLRGSIVYLFIFAMLRLLRRQAGALGLAYILVVVLIADAAQNAMTSEYKSITEGLILVTTIVFWDFLLNWLDFRFPWFGRLVTPTPLLLIKDGRVFRRNLRGELITEQELMVKLREHGAESLEEVKEAYLEPDGNISVITKSNSKKPHVEKKVAS